MRPAGIFAVASLAVGLGALATLIAGIVIIGVGLSYNPDARGGYAGWALFGVVALVIALVLLVRRHRRGPLEMIPSIVALVMGVLFAGPVFVMAMGDLGDLLLYLGPVLLGVGLLVLGFEPGAKRGSV